MLARRVHLLGLVAIFVWTECPVAYGLNDTPEDWVCDFPDSTLIIRAERQGGGDVTVRFRDAFAAAQVLPKSLSGGDRTKVVNGREWQASIHIFQGRVPLEGEVSLPSLPSASLDGIAVVPTITLAYTRSPLIGATGGGRLQLRRAVTMSETDVIRELLGVEFKHCFWPKPRKDCFPRSDDPGSHNICEFGPATAPQSILVVEDAPGLAGFDGGTGERGNRTGTAIGRSLDNKMFEAQVDDLIEQTIRLYSLVSVDCGQGRGKQVFTPFFWVNTADEIEITVKGDAKDDVLLDLSVQEPVVGFAETTDVVDRADKNGPFIIDIDPKGRKTSLEEINCLD